jgi:hypothetical protein
VPCDCGLAHAHEVHACAGDSASRRKTIPNRLAFMSVLLRLGEGTMTSVECGMLFAWLDWSNPVAIRWGSLLVAGTANIAPAHPRRHRLRIFRLWPR